MDNLKAVKVYVEKGELIGALYDADAITMQGVKIITQFPAADVALVRHGMWIEYTKVIVPEPYNKWEQAWKCSECGFDDGFVGYNYCPNCGAKMDLDELYNNGCYGKAD